MCCGVGMPRDSIDEREGNGRAGSSRNSRRRAMRSTRHCGLERTEKSIIGVEIQYHGTLKFGRASQK